MVFTVREGELPVWSVRRAMSVRPYMTATPWCVLLGITLWLEPNHAPSVWLDRSVLLLQLQGQHALMATTVLGDKLLVLSALPDTTVLLVVRTKNQSFVELESIVLLDLLHVQTVMLDSSVLREVSKKTHLRPSVHWDTIALQGLLLKHLVTRGNMVQLKA